MRIGIGLAAMSLVAVGACGGGSSDVESKGASQSATPTQSPTLAKLTAGQACAQVQQVNDELDGPGNWPIATYGEFGDKTYLLYRESAPEIADALEDLSAKALYIGELGGGSDEDFDSATNAVGEWNELYQDVADICARTDSPIGRLP